VGFIGHSFDVAAQPSGAEISVGLLFGSSALVRTPDHNNPDLNYTITNGTNPIQVTQINTQAKVVFVGSCFIGPIFEALWNITPSTKGQALIVPIGSQAVILGHALAAWENILDDLVNKHMTVGDAVNQTNSYLPTTLDNNLNHPAEQYQVIGDASVKITK